MIYDKWKAVSIVLIVLLILALGFGGYFGYKYYQMKQRINYIESIGNPENKDSIDDSSIVADSLGKITEINNGLLKITNSDNNQEEYVITNDVKINIEDEAGEYKLTDINKLHKDMQIYITYIVQEDNKKYASRIDVVSE